MDKGNKSVSAVPKSEVSGSKQNFLREALVSYFYVALWISLSFSVIIYNKYILDAKLYGWSYPISLTMIHMGFCSSIAFLLIRVFKVVDAIDMPRDVFLTGVVPIGALYSLSLWFSNSAYMYLSVSFIQMLKALMPVAVYGIGILASKEFNRASTWYNMICITAGVAVAAYGEVAFNVTGITLQLGAVAVEATRLVLIQILLTSRGIKLNPITTLYYVAPCCFVFLSGPWAFLEVPYLLTTCSFKPDFFIFGTNSLVAFALNLAVFLLVGKTSALTMNVAGVVKDWLLIAFSWSVIKDRVSGINLFGYGIAFFGVCWYNYSKLKSAETHPPPSSTRGNGSDVGVQLLDKEERS